MSHRTTTHTHRRTTRTNPTSTAPSTTSAAVYNLTHHFSNLSTSSRSHNPPPQPNLVNPHLHLPSKGLSRSAIFEPPKPHFDPRSTGQKSLIFEKRKTHVGQSKKGLILSEKKKIGGEEEQVGGEFRGKTVKFEVGNCVGVNRRLVCESEVELSNFLITNSAKVVSADMPTYMQIHAVGCARKTKDSLEKFTSKSLAVTLKKEFDGAYGPVWHCIVGTSYGSFVTHSVGGFLYFSLDLKLYVLLFKTTVQRADK